MITCDKCLMPLDRSDHVSVEVSGIKKFYKREFELCNVCCDKLLKWFSEVDNDADPDWLVLDRESIKKEERK